MTTPEEAAETLLCPLARTFANKEAKPYCRGPECAVWRWVPLPADLPEFQEAIAARKAEIGKGGPHWHKEAVAWVMENREALGIPLEPSHGYCGIGGAP